MRQAYHLFNISMFKTCVRINFKPLQLYLPHSDDSYYDGNGGDGGNDEG